MMLRICIATALLCGLANCADRVLLKDVTAITLTEGAKTNGRRSSPVPQLTCTGGSAYGRVDEPRIVQCKNVGFDGSDVQWECKAELDTRVKFGRLSVSCEGYNHPDDPFVLRGSCGLEYELDWKSGADTSSGYYKKSSYNTESVLTYLAIAFIIGVVIYMIYNAAPADQGPADPPGFRRFGTGFDHGPGGPPGGGGGHPGYPGSGPPPRYDDLHGKGSSSGSSGAGHANDGPGFWTGAGLGALGGYFMGRNQDNQYGGGPRYRGSEYQRSTGFFSSAYNNDGASTSSGSGSSWGGGGGTTGTTSRSTATGYASTTRR